MTGPRILGDRYEIHGVLGRGGMATVYRGRDRVLDRAVAIKVLADKYAGDEKFVTRFQREARAAAGLNHRNIVSVYDTGDTDGEHYIVMELVQGETLADLLRRQGPLSPDDAARVAAGVAEALQAAHARGLIHRDVKPANVMLTPAGEVKVMDFGIARAATDDTLTQTGLIMGTASYLSPEQSRGDPVDHRSDIYSLGCVTYEMLAGRPPFTAEKPLSVAYKHVHDRPEPPSTFSPSIPPETEAVVMRALEKDPDARFASAEDFRQAVTAAASGEPTEPLAGDTAMLPASPTEPLEAERARRSWVPVALIGALLLVAGIVALAMAGDEDRGREGRRQRAERQQRPSPETSPTAVALLGVEEAASALQELVSAQLADGLVSEDVAKKILEEAQKAIDEYFQGKAEDALTHLAEAETAIQVGLLEGSIASEETGTSLALAVEALEAAMLANPLPPETPDDEEGEEEGESEGEGDGNGGDSGPGNSENAPGHEKKGKDDD